MPKELNKENLTEAFCRVLACTGIGAAENDCDEVLPKLVKVVVPQEMHDDYPPRLLACATEVCSKEPYGWRVDQIEPTIADDTLFQQLCDGWFTDILWPA